MKIVLLEFIDEFDAFNAYIHQMGLRTEDFLMVALDPKVGAHLKARNIQYKDTTTYFNSDSHRRILVETEKAMVLIRQRFDFCDGQGLKGCYQAEFALWLRLFMNHLLRVLEIIKGVSEQHSDAEWYAYVGCEVSAQAYIGSQERYCGILTKRFAEIRGMSFFNINQNPPVVIPSEKKPYRSSMLERLFLGIVLRLLRHKRVIVLPRIESPLRGLAKNIYERDKSVIFLAIESQDGLAKTAAINANLFMQSCFGKSQAPYFVINAEFCHPRITPAQKEALSRSIDTIIDAKHKKIFTYLSVEYLDLFRKKVECAIRPHLERILTYSHALRHIFGRLNTYMVISNIGIGIMAVAGEMARAMNRKSLFISHGTHPAPIDPYHELELLSNCRTFMLGDYTHVALCTPVQEEHLWYFKRKYPEIINEEVKTGPLIFTSLGKSDKVRHKKQFGIPEDCCVFTHAVSIKPRYAQRFYFLETMDEFFSGIADIINVLNRLDNVRLILRVHPGFNWSDEEIKLLLPVSDRYIISQTGPFSDVLGATDVLISYSSTTIDEALINRIPVVLYDKWNRYNHFQTGVFIQDDSTDVYPVCYVNSSNKLEPALRFMVRKTNSTNREDMDVERYCYKEDYRDNFYSFIRQSLSRSGNGLAFNIVKAINVKQVSGRKGGLYEDSSAGSRKT